MNQAITSTIHKTPGGNPDTGAVEAVPTLTQVYEAIRQLHEAGEEPTRDRIHKMTGLNLTTVDDRIKVLRGEGMIAAVKQCYRPVHQHGPARDVVIVHLNDGRTLVEIGEHVLHLVRPEAARLARERHPKLKHDAKRNTNPYSRAGQYFQGRRPLARSAD